ncbi:MAG TPA: HEAT repeat domain-containing protein [Candidatus Aminicenantes bacterium]|nr:HEAT repeat domain-containing protein [Candidatus Aminicenantes bacterium]
MEGRRSPEAAGLSPVCAAFALKLGRTPDRAARRRILAACAKVDRPWVEELMWEALADPSEAVRAFAAAELGRRPSLRLDLAARRLRLPPWFARSAALGIVGAKRAAAAGPEVARAAGDANADVRRAAARALGELGGEEALRVLVRLKKDPNPYVRAAAEAAIGKTSGVRFI